jgi:hypothetical protein
MYLNIPDSDESNDEFILFLISSAESQIERYCGRKFNLQTYTNEKHNINHLIIPDNYPITEVLAIRRKSNNVDQFTDEVTLNTGYRIYPSYIEMLDGKYVSMTNKLSYPQTEESYVEIDYIAGYMDIPFDLQVACSKLVALEYKNSKEDRLGIDSDQVGPLSTTYRNEESGMPKDIAIVLNSYKKKRV